MIDKYAYTNRLNDVHPGEKVALAVITMLINFIPDVYLNIIVMFVMAFIVVILAGIPLRVYMRLLLIPLSFLVLSTLTIIINEINPHTALWNIKLFNTYIGIEKSGLKMGILLFFRSMSIVSCLYFLSLTTPMVEIMSVLKKLRVPALFIEFMQLIYRFLFVLMETTESIFTSQDSRLGYSTMGTSLKSMTQLISVLFVKSYRDANELYTSLEARCYTGELNVMEKEYKVSFVNIAGISLFESVLVLFALFTGGILK